MKTKRNARIAACALAALACTMIFSGCQDKKQPQEAQTSADPAATLAIPDNVEIMTEAPINDPVQDTVQNTDPVDRPEETDTSEIPDNMGFGGRSPISTDETAAETTVEVGAPPAFKAGDDIDYKTLSENVKALMDNAEAFKMDCTVIGIVPTNGATMSRLINHTYAYDITQEATHLTSSVQDSNNPDNNSKYDEYQTFEDSVITTYTVNAEGYWCDDVPKIFSRDNMVKTTVNGIGFLEAFADPETFANAEITKDENGLYNMTCEWYKLNIEDDDNISGYNLYGGLIRALDIDDSLLGMDPYDMNGSITYVFDSDLYPISISADITSLRAPDKCDMHVDMRFKNWNNVRRISVPYLHSSAIPATTTVATAPAVTEAPVTETDENGNPVTTVPAETEETSGTTASTWAPPPAVTTGEGE
jgi:hypothetical protein